MERRALKPPPLGEVAAKPTERVNHMENALSPASRELSQRESLGDGTPRPKASPLGEVSSSQARREADREGKSLRPRQPNNYKECHETRLNQKE